MNFKGWKRQKERSSKFEEVSTVQGQVKIICYSYGNSVNGRPNGCGAYLTIIGPKGRGRYICPKCGKKLYFVIK